MINLLFNNDEDNRMRKLVTSERQAISTNNKESDRSTKLRPALICWTLTFHMGEV